MAVDNNTILNKMMNELHKAKDSQQQPNQFRQHIANVKLLCDLFLEEDRNIDESVSNQEEFSEAELKAMIGEQAVVKKVGQQQVKRTVTIDHDDANGNSIFDF